MQKIQSLVEHIVNAYGFEITHCSIPKNNFQYLKRNFYLFINRKISNIIFKLLMKLSPIRFMSSRPNGDIYLQKRIDGRLSEIMIEPIPVEATIYTNDTKGLFKIDASYNYRVEVSNISFVVNGFTTNEHIDIYFMDIPEFKETIRDYKLSKLFNYA